MSVQVDRNTAGLVSRVRYHKEKLQKICGRVLSGAPWGAVFESREGPVGLSAMYVVDVRSGGACDAYHFRFSKSLTGVISHTIARRRRPCATTKTVITLKRLLGLYN
jgi:hypothetical protein